LLTPSDANTQDPGLRPPRPLLAPRRLVVPQSPPEGQHQTVVRRALEDRERGLGTLGLAIDDDALALLAREADGDARRALQALEAAAEYITGKGEAGRVPA